MKIAFSVHGLLAALGSLAVFSKEIYQYLLRILNKYDTWIDTIFVVYHIISL